MTKMSPPEIMKMIERGKKKKKNRKRKEPMHVNASGIFGQQISFSP
jgi:hypothetical protein